MWRRPPGSYPPLSTDLRYKYARRHGLAIGELVSYRNKTYVAFSSEDIRLYYLMEAWRENEKIDFSFFDAHDLYVSRDTSRPETIRTNLRQRLSNAKQVVLIGTSTAKKKGDDGQSFLWYEVETIIKLKLPVVVANHDGDRTIDQSFIPDQLLNADYHSMSVSFQPAIIKYALDNYAATYATSTNKGPHYYKSRVYEDLGL